MPIRVVIAEDNALLRDGLARLISSTHDFELVGTGGSLDELLTLVEESNPDVVVTDIRMPPTGTDEGIRAAAALRSSHPLTGVIVSANMCRLPTRCRCCRKVPSAAGIC